MKTLTKKELSDIHKLANKLNFDDFCKAMQSFSDQQIANLKLINKKQAKIEGHYSQIKSLNEEIEKIILL